MEFLSNIDFQDVKSGIVSGYPAVDHSRFKRINASIMRAPDMLKRITDLENKVSELKNIIESGKLSEKSENNS